MEWFKFYNSKWLSDLAIISLDPIDRLCFITLLCVTAQSDDRDGTVSQCDEHHVLMLSHLSPEYYKRGVGFMKRLIDIGLVEQLDGGTIRIKNFEKRQNSLLTGAERTKRYRDKLNVTKVTEKSHKSNARVEESRVDKKRVEREYSSISFLRNIPENIISDLSVKYKIDPKGIKSKAYDLVLYCEQKGKRYSNYKSFLENAIRKDKNKLQVNFPYIEPKETKEQEKPLTPEQIQRNRELKAGIANMLRSKT